MMYDFTYCVRYNKYRLNLTFGLIFLQHLSKINKKHNIFNPKMKSKAKLFQKIMNDVRTKHRLMTLGMLGKLQKYEEMFYGKRFVFKNPRVKNRTYKVLGLEFKKFSLKSKKKKSSTGFIAIKNNASFFGYALSEIQLDFVKMQNDGYDKQLLEIESKIHTEFSDKTRNIINDMGAELLKYNMLQADIDFYIASTGYKAKDITPESMHQGKLVGLGYNPSLNEIDIIVYSNTQGKQFIRNEEHIVNIWN